MSFNRAVSTFHRNMLLAYPEYGGSQNILPEQWYQSARLHSTTSQKTVIFKLSHYTQHNETFSTYILSEVVYQRSDPTYMCVKNDTHSICMHAVK